MFQLKKKNKHPSILALIALIISLAKASELMVMSPRSVPHPFPPQMLLQGLALFPPRGSWYLNPEGLAHIHHQRKMAALSRSRRLVLQSRKYFFTGPLQTFANLCTTTASKARFQTVNQQVTEMSIHVKWNGEGSQKNYLAAANLRSPLLRPPRLPGCPQL